MGHEACLTPESETLPINALLTTVHARGSLCLLARRPTYQPHNLHVGEPDPRVGPRKLGAGFSYLA